MNAITHALKTAGVQVPSQTQRIWVWLKDHQPQTAKQIAAALHLPQASSLLAQMEKRRMVTSVKERDRSSDSLCKRYSTVGAEYVLLPLPLAPKTAKVFDPDTHFKPGPIVQCSQAAPSPAGFDLDSLTIAEARAVYTQLHAMFGGV